MKTFSKTNEQFKKDFEYSQPAVELVEKILLSRGFSVVRGDEILYEGAERGTKDAGDLFLTGLAGVPLRVEVKRKGLKYKFRNRETYPFPDIMVDEAYKIARLPIEELYGYFIMSPDLEAGCFIGVNTRKNWSTRLVYDKISERSIAVMECPMEEATFFTCKMEPPLYRVEFKWETQP